MARFDGYYGGATDIPPVGKACVDRVIFKMLPENASRVAALLAGDVHIIDALPTHAVKQVENNPGTHVLSVRGTRSSYIAFNNQKPPLDHERVHHAAAHAPTRHPTLEQTPGGKAHPLHRP